MRVGTAMVSSVIVAAAVPAIVDAPHANAAAPNVAGMIVFLDPGHNGANDASISRQVPTGRGGTKDCQASGTSTEDGYPEHTFTWDTTLRVRAILNQMGVRTAMSRGNDNALGPCVDERASMANALRPNAIVSIHADGGPANGRGFHVLYSSPPLNNVQAGPVRCSSPRPCAISCPPRVSRRPPTSVRVAWTPARTSPGSTWRSSRRSSSSAAT